jgi:hypothetical protein
MASLHSIIRSSPQGSFGGLFYWDRHMSGKSNSAQKVPADIALIVWGTNLRKKQCASRFGTDAMKSAQEAAKTMGMRSLRVVSDEQREIARKLPKGTMSPKGRVVIPLVRPALYNRLLAIAGTDAPQPAPPGPPPADASKKPTPATDTKSDGSGGTSGPVKGDLVLATDDPTAGWFACQVEHVDHETLTLRWQGWPELGKFNRKLTQVAVHPKGKPC